MTPTEDAVASTISAVLRVQDLTPQDDIFDLGGDSLQAVQVALKLELQFDIDLPIESLEAATRICEIAALIDAKVAEGSASTRSAP